MQEHELPGYIDEWDDHNYSVFRDHYLAMLDVYYGDNGTEITSCIEEDAVFVPHCESRVFSVNEMAFELRAARRRHTVIQEKAIRNRWVKRVIKERGADAGLDFLLYLRASRKKRDDNFFQKEGRGGYGHSD
jgi:hypothetical protein